MKPTYTNITNFLGTWNRGEFPHYRLGQAFVNPFGHDYCKGHNEVSPCLFHQTNNSLTIKAIWEMVEEDDK